MGAGRLDRVKKGVINSFIIGCIYSAFGLVVMILLGEPLSLLFLDQGEADIIAMTKYFMVVDAVFGVLLTGVNVFRLLHAGPGLQRLAIFCRGCLR